MPRKSNGKHKGEKGYTHQLYCSESVYNAIVVDCIKEFLEHNPTFKGMRISQDFILRRIARHYLGHDINQYNNAEHKLDR